MDGIFALVTCFPLAFSGAFSFFASEETVGVADWEESEPHPAITRLNARESVAK